MLTSLSEPAIVKTALKNGANGFLLKNMQKEELLDCFSRVLAGETYLHKEMEKLLLQNSLGIKQETNYIPKLSRREQEVLDLIAREHTSQEIAEGIQNVTGTVSIIGHTDNDGKDTDNLVLSQKRAASVKRALVNEFGIPAEKLTTDGKGESQPLNKNSNPAEKAQNRRVEFIIQ